MFLIKKDIIRCRLLFDHEIVHIVENFDKKYFITKNTKTMDIDSILYLQCKYYFELLLDAPTLYKIKEKFYLTPIISLDYFS